MSLANVCFAINMFILNYAKEAHSTYSFYMPEISCLSHLSIIFVSRALLIIAADCCIYVFVFSAAPILNNKTLLFAI